MYTKYIYIYIHMASPFSDNNFRCVLGPFYRINKSIRSTNFGPNSKYTHIFSTTNIIYCLFISFKCVYICPSLNIIVFISIFHMPVCIWTQIHTYVSLFTVELDWASGMQFATIRAWYIYKGIAQIWNELLYATVVRRSVQCIQLNIWIAVE